MPRLLLLCLVALLASASAQAQRVVALSGDGTMRILTDSDCSGSACDWATIDRNPRSIQVAASETSLFQLHENGWIYMWKGEACEGTSCPSWTRLDSNPRTKAIVANNSNLFQLHDNGSIWRWKGQTCDSGPCSSWERLDRNTNTVELAASGAKLFQRHRGGSIWQWKGEPCAGATCASWERLDRNANTRQIAAGGPGSLYQRHENGSIWRWDGRPCAGNSCSSWTRLDGNPRTSDIIAASGGLYQVHNTGRVWRWTGQSCQGSSCPGWESLYTEAFTKAIAAGATPVRGEFSSAAADPAPVFQVRGAETVWRWNGQPCTTATCTNWTQVDNREAFTSYSDARGGLYVFDGNPPPVSSAAPVGTATAEDFGFDGLQFARTGPRTVRMNVLLMLTEYSDTEFEAGQTQEFYEQKYFGRDQGLEAYFNANSRLITYEINHVGTVKVEDTRSLPCAHRWESCPTGTDGGTPWMATVEHLEGLPGSAVEDLAQYDANSDGTLSTDELFVLKVEGTPDRSDAYPYDDNGGLRRGLPRCASLRGTSKRICGTFLPIADETNFATTAHEFAHLLGGRDLYGPTFGNSSGFTLMGGTISDNEFFFHLDPWHKMRMGMVRPRILPIPEGTSSRQTLNLTLPSNRASYEPVLFYDPARGTNEYFMLEYRRSRGGAFDGNVPGNGLVIWYVKTNDSHTPDVLESAYSTGIQGQAVAIVGAPDQTPATGRSWTSGDGQIRLRWPDGSDTGLRLRVSPVGSTDSFLRVDWWTP